ncbi:MAG: TadE/TadG family type IV pilus assembly protein [Acidobacteriaceae bacterium]
MRRSPEECRKSSCHWREVADGEQGSALVETALTMSLALMLALSVLEFCMMTYTYATLGEAAREGVRYATMHGTGNSTCSGPSQGCGDANGANVIAVVQQYAAYSLHNVSGMNVQVTYPDGASTPGSRVQVQISYPYVPYVKVPGTVLTMDLSDSGRILN